MANADLLRQQRLTEIDVDNIAEELESMAKRDRRELLSRLKILLMHLLKWHFQADKCTKSWKSTINEQREPINLLLSDSPSLKNYIRLNDAYRLGLKVAIDETGLAKSIFPASCPYSLVQILNENFYPDNLTNKKIN
ncbi:MAG: DUF29 domain-containing protein [Thiomargarita sp.]|nr:DUF29 domain-containing protein [Thiomargarita sp.]